MSDQKQIVVKTPGFPVLGVLGIVFVTLKLLGHITWSWWWVTAPFWAMPVIAITMIVTPLAIIGIAFAGAWIADQGAAAWRKFKK